MSSHTVQLTRSARKELEALPDEVQDRIVAAIEPLAERPRPPGCKKLKGAQNTYRIRVGEYRVIYEVDDKIAVVLVIRIRHRKDAY
jgi:mRNA interferase RelE/StbE